MTKFHRWLMGCLPWLAMTGWGAEVFLLPQGAGARDGSSLANALAASQGGWQRAWDALPPGGTLVLGSGDYGAASLTITNGGEPGRPKSVRGVDSGGGLPRFSGTFDRARPAKSGHTVVLVPAAAAHWAVSGLRLRNCAIGVLVRAGASHFTLADLEMVGMREGIRLTGAAHAEIRDCRMTNYTKRGLRLVQAGPGLRISGCTADAGGAAWATEPFHIGFAIESTTAEVTPATAVTFTGCEARNHYHNAGAKYWNADGFCAEREALAVRYVRCGSYDNTDGGWDDKGPHTVLEDCRALGNKRNFRFWGGATLTGCVTAFARHPGGSGGAAGLWCSGRVTARRTTWYGNPAAISFDGQGTVELEQCLVVRPGPLPETLWNPELARRVQAKETVVAVQGDPQTDPQLEAPAPGWKGEGNAFYSRRYGAQCGVPSRGR
jgi:hypothetical protein